MILTRIFTPRQGQYLAFIHAYTLVNGRPPAQADIQRFFRLTPPSVHQMLLTLEREGLISRRPGVPRSIAVLVDRSALPALEPGYGQPVKITVQSTSQFARCTVAPGAGYDFLVRVDVHTGSPPELTTLPRA